MSNTTTTPFMGLELPIVGVQTGPLYASDVNSAFDTIDGHNHTSGQGASIPTAGLSLDTDLPLNGLNIENVRSVRLAEQGAPLALTGDVGSISNVNGDLYYNNGGGTPVQITSGAGLNFASLGTIGGDYGQPLVNASVVYSNTTKTFSFTQETNRTGKMFFGDIQLADAATVGANAITVKADAATTAYTTKLPTALPASGAIMTVDTSGNQSFTEYLSTFEISSGEFRLKDNGTAFVKQQARGLTQFSSILGSSAASPNVAFYARPNSISFTNSFTFTDLCSFDYTVVGNKPLMVFYKAQLILFTSAVTTFANFEIYMQINGVDRDNSVIGGTYIDQKYMNVNLEAAVVLAPGTYNIKVLSRYSTISGSGNGNISNQRLLAYEV